MKKGVVKILVGVLVAGAVLGGAALGAILWQIHQSVQECCGVAQQAHPHPGDDVAALAEFVTDESYSLRDRNMGFGRWARCATRALCRPWSPSIPGICATMTRACVSMNWRKQSSCAEGLRTLRGRQGTESLNKIESARCRWRGKC